MARNNVRDQVTVTLQNTDVMAMLIAGTEQMNADAKV